MALKAIIDPARRRLQSAAQKQAPTGTDQMGVRKAISAINVIPKKKAAPGQPPIKPPVAPPADQPNVYSANPNTGQPTDQRQTLTQIADSMKTARESGDLGTLLKTTNEKYLPELQKWQTSVGNVDTAQVSKILGEDQAIPQDLPSQQKMLTDLASQLQKARETGDLGTANRLGQQYANLVKTMQAQVTGQPVNAITPTPLPGGEGSAASVQELNQRIERYKMTGQQELNQRIERYKMTGQPVPPELQAQLDAAISASQTKVPDGYTYPDQINMMEKATAGGPPGSTVPSGETDASVTQGSQTEVGPTGTATFDAATAWAGRLQNPGLITRGPGGTSVPDPRGAQKIQQLADFDNQFVAGFPPEAQGWVSERMASEQKTFEAALAQYPDQWDKIFRDHQTRVNEIQEKWNSVGQWESKLKEIMNQAPPETKVKIEELMKQGNDAALNAALEDLKAGKDPVANIDKYLEKFGAKAEFDLGQPGFEIPDYKLDEFQKADGIEIAGADNVDLTTDKSRIDAALARSGMTAEGAAALKLQLETIQKRLSQGGGGFSDDELKSMAAPLLDQLKTEEASAVSALQHDLANQGITGPGANDQVSALRQDYTNKREAAVMELVRENMGYKQQGTSEAISALGGVAQSEADRALTEKGLQLEGATTQTALTSEEKKAQAQANLAQKALNQEGELAVWGTKVDENLAAYGFKLDQYKSDKGFDLERYKTDLDERVAQGDLDVKEAQLAYTKVKDSIDAAQKETEAYDRRNETIAGLRQRMAEGDQDADYRIQALEVQQELTALGIKTEWSSKIASIIYGVRSRGLELNQEMKMFLEQMAATKEAQESSGFMDFVGSVVGGVGGSFLGPIAGAAGAKIGSELFGGGA